MISQDFLDGVSLSSLLIYSPLILCKFVQVLKYSDEDLRKLVELAKRRAYQRERDKVIHYNNMATYIGIYECDLKVMDICRYSVLFTVYFDLYKVYKGLMYYDIKQCK